MNSPHPNLRWKFGDIAVCCLDNRPWQIIERYNWTFNPACVDYRAWDAPGDHHKVIRAKHLRLPMPGERRGYQRARAALALAEGGER